MTIGQIQNEAAQLSATILAEPWQTSEQKLGNLMAGYHAVVANLAQNLSSTADPQGVTDLLESIRSLIESLSQSMATKDIISVSNLLADTMADTLREMKNLSDKG